MVRKSRQPRLKTYYDAEGNLQTVEVYRYYCRNLRCDKKSFTNLPPGLMPHSPYRTEVHLLATQMYAWGYSTYRRTGTALAEALEQTIYHVFDAETKRTAHKRYAEVMALRVGYVAETPAAAIIFDFLERHWPTLVNGIESDLIPRTNDTVELVIRRFDQHYQNFCGFESIDSAHLFLGVFEKLYRFTPFSQDAQPRIRGKCPLELAGYDISQVPMASLCAGLSVVWPLEVAQEHVPNL